MPNNGLDSLTLFDYSDRELLLIVMEQAEAEEDGYAPTTAIAEAIGMTGNRRNNSVGSRLAALRRLGLVEKNTEKVESRWTASAIGKLMATGKLNATAERTLREMKPEQMVLLTRFVTGRYSEAPEAAAHMIRREFVRGVKRY